MEEIHNAPEEVTKELFKLVTKSDIDELFGIIDKDGSGEISLEEFFEGITNRCVKQISMVDLRIMSYMEDLRARIDQTQNALTAHILTSQSESKSLDSLRTRSEVERRRSKLYTNDPLYTF